MLCALIEIERRLMTMAKGLRIKRTKIDFAFAPQSWLALAYLIFSSNLYRFCQFDSHLLNTHMIKLGMNGDEDQQLFIEELTSLLAKKRVNDDLINTLKDQLEGKEICILLL